MIPVIHAHPDSRSFTTELASAITGSLAGKGLVPREVDLYRCNGGSPFPPLMDAGELRRKTSLDPVVLEHMRLVEQADGYVVVHPDWWGGPPAVLKGWIDRVLRPGTAYEVPEVFGSPEPSGLLAGRKALVVVTGDSGGPGPLEAFWNERIWGFCSVDSRVLYLPAGRKDSITEAAGRAADLFTA